VDDHQPTRYPHKFLKKENKAPMAAFEVTSTCRRQDDRGFFSQFCDVAEEAIINNMI
jgi:ABC-type Fe2+-enterobactin transport system substrate-binding protein